MLVLSSTPQRSIHINSTLQATAVRIALHRSITLCSIYIPRASHVSLQELIDLVDQLPPLAVLMGDFNAHSPLWGNSSLDSRGKIVEDLMAATNLCIINDKTPTYIHPATGSKTSIDLTMVDPSLVLDFSWSVYDDLSGSDYSPIIMKSSKTLPQQTLQRWKIQKGDWTSFQELCKDELAIGSMSPIQNHIAGFTNQLISVVERTVPKSNPNTTRIRKPWFDDACREAVANRKRALRTFS